ncbi:MAG: type II toxin-antitoxin system VapC family toxin [Terriglobales bacterium]
MKAVARTFVLDASVALSWCFEDEASDFAEGILDLLRTGSEAVAPAIWPLEVTNALLIAEWSKRISEAKVMSQLRDIRRLPVLIEPIDLDRAFDQILSVARQRHLTEYDAAYLELALWRALPLATLDKQLRRAARQAGVTLMSI